MVLILDRILCESCGLQRTISFNNKTSKPFIGCVTGLKIYQETGNSNGCSKSDIYFDARIDNRVDQPQVFRKVLGGAL